MLRTKGNYSNTLLLSITTHAITGDWYHYTMLVPMDTMK